MTKRSLGIMLVFGLVAGVLAALPAQAATPIPAKANIEDPVNDANFVNDQGLAGTGGCAQGQCVAVPDEGDHTTPEDNSTASDIIKVWFSHTPTDISAHFLLQNPPPKASSLAYNVYASPGDGSGEDCIRFRAFIGGVAQGNSTTFQGPDVAKLIDACNDGTNFWDNGVAASIIIEALDDGTGILTLTGPRAYSPLLADGLKLTAPYAWTTLLAGQTGAAFAGGTIDDTKPGLDYLIDAGTPSVEPSPPVEPPGKSDPPGEKKGCKKGKGEKKGCKKNKPKPPTPAPPADECAAYTPGDQGKDAPTVVVTDAATADKPVETTISIDAGAGTSLVPQTDAATTAAMARAFHNVQVDSAAPGTGLYVRLEMPMGNDYDLFLRNPDGSTVTQAAGFNPEPAICCGDDGGAQTENEAEQLNGVATADCQGYTVDVATGSATGGDLTLKFWLGEVKYTPGGAALREAALSLF